MGSVSRSTNCHTLSRGVTYIMDGLDIVDSRKFHVIGTELEIVYHMKTYGHIMTSLKLKWLQNGLSV